MKYDLVLDYNSEYVGLWSPKPVTKEGERVYFNASLLPAETFLRVFHNPTGFSELLMLKVDELCEEWMAANSSRKAKSSFAENPSPSRSIPGPIAGSRR